MCMQMQRIFFPVGQGAYYMERMVDSENAEFTSIYDCGVLPKSNKSIKQVKQTLRQGEQIDILFIA